MPSKCPAAIVIENGTNLKSTRNDFMNCETAIDLRNVDGVVVEDNNFINTEIRLRTALESIGLTNTQVDTEIKNLLSLPKSKVEPYLIKFRKKFGEEVFSFAIQLLLSYGMQASIKYFLKK